MIRWLDLRRPVEKHCKMRKYELVVALLIGPSSSSFARDEGRNADDPLKHWFDNLSSGLGSPMAFRSAMSIGR